MSILLKLHFVRQEPEADDARSFFFRPDSSLQFRAGQYLRYTLPHSDPDRRGISRSFTIASFPGEPLIRLTTRLSTSASTFKQTLARLQPGATVDATGPFGQFVYTASDLSHVFIAGGIGITPIRSILGDLACRGVDGSSTLLYSSTTEDIPLRAELDAFTRMWPALRAIYTVTRPGQAWTGLRGRIDAEFIEAHVPDLAQSQFFVSGPTPMVDAIRANLAGIGIHTDRVKHEAFPGYDR